MFQAYLINDLLACLPRVDKRKENWGHHLATYTITVAPHKTELGQANEIITGAHGTYLAPGQHHRTSRHTHTLDNKDDYPASAKGELTVGTISAVWTDRTAQADSYENRYFNTVQKT